MGCNVVWRNLWYRRPNVATTGSVDAVGEVRTRTEESGSVCRGSWIYFWGLGPGCEVEVEAEVFEDYKRCADPSIRTFPRLIEPSRLLWQCPRHIDAPSLSGTL